MMHGGGNEQHNQFSGQTSAASFQGSFVDISPIKQPQMIDSAEAEANLIFQPPTPASPFIDINQEVEKLVQDQLATLKDQQRSHFLTDIQNNQVQDFLASLHNKQTNSGQFVESEFNVTDEVLGENPEIYSIDALLDILKNPKPSNSPKSPPTAVVIPSTTEEQETTANLIEQDNDESAPTRLDENLCPVGRQPEEIKQLG